MRNKFNRTETLREIAKIDRQLETLDFALQHFGRWGYNTYRPYYNNGITSFLYNLAGTKCKESGSSIHNIIDEKIEADYKASVKPGETYDYNTTYTLKSNFWRKVEEKKQKPLQTLQDTLRKTRSKLMSDIFHHRGLNNKKYRGESLADKIRAGEEENINGYRFCTRTGREVTINFEMRHPTERDWSKCRKTPTTWFDIGIMKIEGFIFQSHFDKLNHGNKSYYNANPKTKLGVLYAASKPGASQEVIDAAHDLRAKMSDSIYCNYLDSGHVGSFKAKDIFILNTPHKKVDKQQYRKVYRGKDREEKMEKDLNRGLRRVGYRY